jgi:hypothetical protein
MKEYKYPCKSSEPSATLCRAGCLPFRKINGCKQNCLSTHSEAELFGRCWMAENSEEEVDVARLLAHQVAECVASGESELREIQR